MSSIVNGQVRGLGLSLAFPTAEWTAALCEALNNSDAYANAPQKWEGDLRLAIDDTGAVYLDLWHGACRKAEFTPDPATVQADFVISGSLTQWTSILNGQMDPIQALVKRKLKLKGNLVMIMKNVKAAQELVACAARLDTSFR